MGTRLRDEVKQTKPFESLEQEAYLNLKRTAAMLGHDVAETLRPFEITPTQYNVLRILRGAGAGGLSRNEVRDRLLTPVPDATRLLDRMEAAGLVERTRDEDDRRYVLSRITPRGLEILERLDEPIAALHKRQLQHVGRGELRSLIRTLERARARE